MTPIRHTTILLVEDDPGHAMLIEMNLRDSGLNNEIIILSDGQAALDYVMDTATATTAEAKSRSLLMLLDLNLPVIDGFEVLRQVKSKAETRKIPVIILTSTDDAEEIARCYALGCNVYLRKPVAYDAFVKAVRELGLFISVIEMPKIG